MIVNEKGTLTFKGEVQTGTSANGRDWGRQTIVISTPGFQGATRLIALEARTRTINDIARLSLNEAVEVAYEVNSREWNGKYYTNADLISIKSLSSAPASEAKPAESAPANDMFAPAQEGEDLPF